MKRLLVLLLGISFAPLLPAEEMDLTIPGSTEEMEKVIDDEDPCKGCGVVTDIQGTKLKNSSNSSQEYELTFAVVDVSSSGLSVEHPEANEEFGAPWQVTIRFDDEFIIHEQVMKPSVEIGDRVQVISGQVVAR